MSCSNLTPAFAHNSIEPLVKHWKNRRKKKSMNATADLLTNKGTR